MYSKSDERCLIHVCLTWPKCLNCGKIQHIICNMVLLLTMLWILLTNLMMHQRNLLCLFFEYLKYVFHIIVADVFGTTIIQKTLILFTGFLMKQQDYGSHIVSALTSHMTLKTLSYKMPSKEDCPWTF
jgi:hypothetical protein